MELTIRFSINILSIYLFLILFVNADTFIPGANDNFKWDCPIDRRCGIRLIDCCKKESTCVSSWNGLQKKCQGGYTCNEAEC